MAAPAPLRSAAVPASFLPDFCASPAVLAVVLISELVAIIFAIARQGLHGHFLMDLAGSSLFLLWIGLTCAGVLCRARPWLTTMSPARASVIAILLLLTAIGVISELVVQLGKLWSHDLDGNLNFPTDHAGFLLRNLAVGFIVSALALRYF